MTRLESDANFKLNKVNYKKSKSIEQFDAIFEKEFKKLDSMIGRLNVIVWNQFSSRFNTIVDICMIRYNYQNKYFKGI